VVKTIAAGVAGAGVFGGYHAGKYAALPDVRLAGVFDVDPRRAEALAARYDAIAFSDFRAFLDAIDVVTVATPAASHYAIAREALESGRHVLVEKPIAMSIAHADRLIAIARERGLTLQVGHQERFIFDAFGLFGRTKRPRSVHCVRRNPRTGRGEDVSVVFDLMIHDIDIVRRLGLAEPVSIDAVGSEHETDARLAFADGAVATFEASRLAPQRERRMSLIYDDGLIEIDFVKRAIRNTTPDATHATFEDPQGSFALLDPLGYGVARFLDAARSAAAPAISGDDGRDALDWALRIDAATVAAPALKTLRA
jgi:predicted dehydrogenase